MRLAWLAALVFFAARRLRRRDVPGTAPLDNRALIQRAKAGDVWAAFVLARRTRCDSVTRLVQTVYPLTAPTPDEADVLLDGYALWESERADDERRRRAILG